MYISKLFRTIIIILFVMVPLNSQTRTYKSKTYTQSNGYWRTTVNGEETRVCPDVISVKVSSLSDTVSLKQYAQIIRYNRLNIVDVKVPYNKIFDYCDSLQRIGFTNVEINTEIKFLYDFQSPDDPNFVDQSYLYNDPNSTNLNINVDSAWTLANGSEHIVDIAIIDNGVDSLWRDLNPSNNIGYDFYEKDNRPYLGSIPSTVYDYHGYAVATIAAAQTNNKYLVSGIAGGDNLSKGARVMSLRLGHTLWQDTSFAPIWNHSVDDAIIYASDNGADVINISFYTLQNSTIDSAIEYSYLVKGLILIAAVGNDQKKYNVAYPASHNLVVGVGGIEVINNEWVIYGQKDTITVPLEQRQLDVVAPARIGVLSFLRPQGFTEPTLRIDLGTSFSTPQVTGFAALLLAKDSTLSNSDVVRIIKETAKIKSKMKPSDIPLFNNGLIDVYAGLRSIQQNNTEYFPERPQQFTLINSGGNAKLRWKTATYQTQGNGTSQLKYRVYKQYYDGSTSGMIPELVATITHNPNLQFHEFTDYSVNISQTGMPVYYRVSFVDKNNRESLLSKRIDILTNELWKGDSEEEETVSPYIFSLEANYPNPFNPNTKIGFTLSRTQQVSVRVFDVLGQHISTLYDGIAQVGAHTVEFKATELPSGVYFYRIDAAEGTQIKKMILMK